MIKTMFDDLNLFSAGDFATVNKQLYDNGVICPSGETTIATTALKVTNSSGNALIGNGSALIKGRVITVSGETVTLSTDGTYKIVLEWSAASDGSSLKALSGSATLVQTDTQYQLLLATVVRSGTSLTVTDGRTFVNKLSGNTALSIQTVPVTATPPTDGQALAYKDGQYVPTSIIDSGFNSNGFYMKYADGTLRCWVNKVSSTGSTANGNSFISTSANAWTFPVAYISRPFVLMSIDKIVVQGANPTGVTRPASTDYTATSIDNIFVWYSAASATVKTEIILEALGKWK